MTYEIKREHMSGREPRNDRQTYMAGNFSFATPAGRRPSVRRGVFARVLAALKGE